MMKLKGAKISGAGNTFFLTSDERKSEMIPSLQQERSALAKKICHEVYGLSCDGLLFLHPGDAGGIDFIWDFFNSDGSSAELCGNALRSAALFCTEILKRNQKKFLFQTASGNISCELLEGQWWATFHRPQIYNSKQPILLRQKRKEAFFVHTGVPHLVIELDHLSFEKDFLEMWRPYCREQRMSPEFQPQGSNVTLISREGEKILAVSYERGVENFTWACGTGAVAAASFLETKKPIRRHDLTMPGGVLTVEFGADSNPRLTGPTEIICQAEFEWK